MRISIGTFNITTFGTQQPEFDDIHLDVRNNVGALTFKNVGSMPHESEIHIYMRNNEGTWKFMNFGTKQPT
ncbi:hypothetical protein DPMN_147638 [Dreissena polymorpha]|uniref:Uncharacterized protein n=1 Tax=Dreissena polymorpha TaxID=45954 RepID=A0A9D4J3J9_DREPO|nr:hypothetical protein DPMN_147638 [Dreissena polymorpha]